MSSLCKNSLTPPSATLIGPHKERGSRGYLDLNIKTRLMCICALHGSNLHSYALRNVHYNISLSFTSRFSLSLSPVHSDFAPLHSYKCDHVTKTRLKCLSWCLMPSTYESCYVLHQCCFPSKHKHITSPFLWISRESCHTFLSVHFIGAMIQSSS